MRGCSPRRAVTALLVAGRTLIVEGRPHPYRGRIREDFRGAVPPDGRLGFGASPPVDRRPPARILNTGQDAP